MECSLEQMEQLPKIVAQRLQAVSRAETHPDANLLAAFTEKSLLPLEQTQILEHLAECAECRKVVAHAQPEQVLQQVAGAAAPLPVRRSWFSGAKLRWAALAACVVVVGAAVISRTRSTQNSPMARFESAPAVVAETQPLANRAPTEERKSNTVNESESDDARFKMSVGIKRDADEVSAAQKQQAADSLSPLRAKQRQPERRSPELVEKNNNAPAVTTNGIIMGRTASPLAVPPQSTVTAQAEDAKSTKKEFSADKAMKAPAATNEVAQAQPPPSPPAAAAKSAPVLADRQLQKGDSGNLGAFNYNAKDGYLGVGASAGTLAGFRGANPRWQLSAEGKLIKSNDAGKSWQTVPVGDKVVFRALCVTGSELWVGGAQGNLFYSSDAGQQWQQVKPTSAGQTLTADIATIEFKDSKHGKVTTADHQTWTTNDGGHDWEIETR